MNHLKNAVLTGLLLAASLVLNAQENNKQDPPPPLPVREVSGIVKDTTDLGVIGATVSLTSDKDTLKTSTNSDGIFIFKNVRSATYTIVVQSIGYKTTAPMRFKQNDLAPRIVMDPIIMKEDKNLLNEVVINGTPSITYKTDTVEYKASDYVVRKNATVDELLKKMEGMEVGNDGSLIHQGQNVTKAKLNGKEYLGGDLANAIKNLPAEIVDKIQIVDDYGDQAARTGVKDGDPEKILNITTRTDKSVGNMLNVNAAAGNNDRYEAGAFGTRINGNQQIGVNGNFRNTVNGVAGDGGRGREGGGGGGNATGGTTTSGNASLSVRDKIGKKINYNFNYNFNGRDVNTLNNSFSKSVTRILDPVTQQRLDTATFASRMGESNNNSWAHTVRLEVEADLDSSNFLRVIPSFNYSSSGNMRRDTVFQDGFRHQDQISMNNTDNRTPRFGLSVFYQHIFKKPRRNLSFQVDLNSNNQESERQQDTRLRIYGDSLETPSLATDSLVNRIIARRNLQDNYRGSLTYVEPLTLNSQLEFNAQVNYNGYDNNATTRNILPSGLSQVIDSLSNIYDYSFTQGRVALNYRYGMSSTSKIRISAGITGVPALLQGTKVSLGTTTRRSSFNVIPIARFEYLWSRQHKIAFNYSGNAVEPSFDQIQPVRDVTNPNNPIIGNPDLKATFVHTIRTDYNNYISNSRLNYSVNGAFSFTDNAVIQNNFDRVDNSGKAPLRIVETYFTNMDGTYNANANYSVNKQLDNRKYNIAFSGRVAYDHRVSLNNGQKNINTVKTFIERLGPRINPTEWFEINPYVSHTYTISDNTLFNNSTELKTLSFNLDGRIYIGETLLFGYDASKSYVRGTSQNVNTSPLVINMYLEKELFNRRGKIGLQAFDILAQNNFVNLDVDANGGYTQTRSNALSRYFMLRFSMRLQKWSGAQGRNGRPVMRRGDGSFMN